MPTRSLDMKHFEDGFTGIVKCLTDDKHFILIVSLVRCRWQLNIPYSGYRIRQNIRGGKLSRFSRILAKRESFPSSQLENFIIIP